MVMVTESFELTLFNGIGLIWFFQKVKKKNKKN